MNKHLLLSFVSFLSGCWCVSGAADGKRDGVGFMDFCGYAKCPVLSNASTRVVLGPHCGGRVLEYSLNGINVLALDPKQDGWVNAPGKPQIDPYGGRCDIGPEAVIPGHPDLWTGPWEAEVIGERKVRLTSLPDQATGVQLIREFELAPDSSRLRCTQIIKNISGTTKNWCHWSRTFGEGGGICVVPLSPESRFPERFISYGPGNVMNYRPQKDPCLTVESGCLVISGPPQFAKLGMDSYDGWLSYLTRKNILFIKRFPTYPGRVYNEMAGLTVSICYQKDRFCELEPIGPKETIRPGKSAAYTEEWELVPFEYPQDGKMDVAKVIKMAEKRRDSIRKAKGKGKRSGL